MITRFRRFSYWKKVLVVIISLALLLDLAALGWFYRYRYILLVSTKATQEMQNGPMEGYTDKMFYLQGEEISFFLRSEGTNNRAVIQ
ncbi:MAG: hypothetical protein M3Q97_09480, partial [Bacteroidota bacterium]|nr:hypothetical protein [Bacteroidota bacterium]